MSQPGEDPYHILATSAVDERLRVLKYGDTFGLFDKTGNIRALGLRHQGLYHEGTRFLSRWELRLDTLRPLLLSSSLVKSNALLAVDLTNPDIHLDGQVHIPHGTLHLFRSKFLGEGTCYERLRLQNFGLEAVSLDLVLEFAADFRDIFEVRGSRRERRGAEPAVHLEADGVVLVYQGLDGVQRTTRVTSRPRPARVEDGALHLRVQVAPQQEQNFHVTLECTTTTLPTRRPAHDVAFTHVTGELRALERTECRISTSDSAFDAWVQRSLADLRMLLTHTEQGLYPYAGVPWYSTPFGRDGLITAMQMLWVQPEVGAGVLRFLAATQAQEQEPERDAEPGKILHEMRGGEMAALGEIPFGRYYGTVDATPLFLMLAGMHYEATGNRALVEELWPHLEAAVRWLEESGDLNGDGFVEYARRTERGLGNQGWKDSFDSVFHADGMLAEAPVALCEVQGYAYAAWQEAAVCAEALGYQEQARRWRVRAEQVREHFEHAFWCAELSTYALALDGSQQLCRVKTSNAGHCLFTGIASRERAARLARLLTSPEFFSGWGIRTVAEGQARYNPMSYHNGSIWPHDNALIAQGFARYGLKEQVLQVFEALYAASLSFELHRLPELYCGFVRRADEGPTLYPVACSPQAWASGAVLMLLQACLGLELDGVRQRLRLLYPVLPAFLDEVRIEGLRVGESLSDLVFHRYPEGASVNVVRRRGALEVMVVK